VPALKCIIVQKNIINAHTTASVIPLKFILLKKYQVMVKNLKKDPDSNIYAILIATMVSRCPFMWDISLNTNRLLLTKQLVISFNLFRQ
jgi:hypothetical protein